MLLEGKVALITGGGTGIGAAVAKRFVEEGAKVCITGRRRDKLEEVAQTLPPGTVTIAPGDCCADEDPPTMVKTALGITGRLDILVNNAAIEMNKSVVDMEPATWRHTLENNLTGPFLMMKAALPAMIGAGGGSIINVSSLAGIRAVPGGPAYCTTKAGLIHLSKQVALDYGKTQRALQRDLSGARAYCATRDERAPAHRGAGHRPRRRLRQDVGLRTAAPHSQAGGHDRPVRLPGQ